MGDIGKCSNLSEKESDNRYKVTNVEEFLERAAILIDRQYKRKDMVKINGIEIKPGMVLTDSNEEKYVVFPAKDYLAVIIFNDEGDFSGWDRLQHTLDTTEIIRIQESPYKTMFDGKVLWEKPKEVVLTMQEIADKFNIPLKNLRIKE